MPALLTSRYFLWALLAAPAVWLVGGFSAGSLFYGEVVHTSGELSVRLMMLAMSATPLMLMFPGRRATRWLMRHRRAFGVSSFAYALLHTIVYVQKIGETTAVLAEAGDPAYLTGWVAFGIFAALAVTSNDASVRRLKLLWRRLHRLVYVGAILTFAHWLLVAFDPTSAFIHAGVLGTLEALRLWHLARIRRSRRPAP